MNETDLQYKRAVLLAKSLEAYFNKFRYTYSEACWEASNIFIAKGFVSHKEKKNYNFTPHVTKLSDGTLRVEVRTWKR